ncbi:MauE/DoxX family redox-associated membrane protein [Flagellimonas sp.]|uniref:MauE/DoxX family redox-associated membrane protein n=1 Tax=Flagellimonas sp. TaxID=2058762 RepID=UPI003BAF2915
MTREGIYARTVTLIGLLLAILFTYTAANKLIHLDLFQLRLGRMPYLAPFAIWISWLIPFLELVIAGLLLFEKYRRMALWGSLLLLGVFTIYIAVVLNFSDSIPCTCGGVISALGWKDHMLFNGAFMLLTLLGLLWSRKRTTFIEHQNTT